MGRKEEGVQRGEAGVEGREESEGQKDRSCDKSEEGGEGRGEEGRGGERRGGGVISTPLLCVLQAPQVNGEWNFLKHFTCMN